MSRIEVRLFSGLRKYYPQSQSGDAMIFHLDDRARLRDLFSTLKIPRKEIAVAMVNGKGEKDDYRLHDGDRVGLFPLIAGG